MAIVEKLFLSVFPAVLASFGGYVAYRTRAGRAEAEDVADRQTTAVQDLQAGDGVVSVEGSARVTGEPVAASMLGTEGAVAVTVVEQRSARPTGDKAGTDWDTIYSTREDTSFVVDDGSGELPVEPPDDGGFEVDSELFEVEPGQAPPEQVQRWLDETDGLSAAADEHRGYRQAVVEDGEDVFATGEAVAADGGVALGVDAHPGEFTVTDMSQAALAEDESWGLAGYVVGAFFLLVGLAPLALIWLG